VLEGDEALLVELEEKGHELWNTRETPREREREGADDEEHNGVKRPHHRQTSVVPHQTLIINNQYSMIKHHPSIIKHQ
jgi:hypothetical protein